MNSAQINYLNGLADRLTGQLAQLQRAGVEPDPRSVAAPAALRQFASGALDCEGLRQAYAQAADACARRVNTLSEELSLGQLRLEHQIAREVSGTVYRVYTSFCPQHWQ